MSANRQRARPEFFYLIAVVALLGALVAPFGVVQASTCSY